MRQFFRSLIKPVLKQNLYRSVRNAAPPKTSFRSLWCLGVAAPALDEVKELIREAIEFRLEGMREYGDPILAPAAAERSQPEWIC